MTDATQQTGPVPSPEAREALASSHRDARSTARLIRKAETEVFAPFRGYVDSNHIADRVKAAILGATAA